MTIRLKATYRDGVFVPLPGQLPPDLPEEVEVEITVQRASSPEAVNGEGRAALLREIAASMKANSFTGDPPRLSGDGLMNALDANVLLYAHDPRDPAKQDRAVEVIASLTDGVLLWHVACEYLAKAPIFRVPRVNAIPGAGKWLASQIPSCESSSNFIVGVKVSHPIFKTLVKTRWQELAHRGSHQRLAAQPSLTQACARKALITGLRLIATTAGI